VVGGAELSGHQFKKKIMENNAPFQVGDKVIAIKDSNANPAVKKNMIFTVTDCRKTTCCDKWFVSVGIPYPDGVGYCQSCQSHQWDRTGFAYHNDFLFRKINPYSNSVSLELANEAIKERVETDSPVKEIVNN
jgi:hypothetical protein